MLGASSWAFEVIQEGGLIVEMNIYTVRETKLFAGFYSLFAGLAFISIVGIIVLPIAHRLPHLLHLESKQSNLSYSALPS